MFESLATFEDIVAYINECYKTQENLESALDEIGILVFSSRRLEMKDRKRTLKNRLRNVREDVRECRSALINYTTFDKGVFLPFLRDYLSLVEGERYGLILGIEELEYVMALVSKTYPLNLYGDNYNIVTTEENKEVLMNSKGSWGCADIDDIHEYLGNLDNDRYICLKDSDKYSLLDGINLSDKFAKYPYLYDLAGKIVNMRLMDPNLSDSEVLDNILNDLRDKNKRR